MTSATRHVVRQGPFKDFIPDGVRSGDTIYLSGQVSIDDAGNVVHPGDLVAQARQAYANVEAILGAFDATMADIVDETLFVTDVGAAMANIEALFAARAEAYGSDPDVAQTLLQVSGLVMPDLEIEIKCVAQL